MMLATARWRLAGVIALLVLLVAPAVGGGRALAHAQLVASSPGSGEVLDEPPSELRLVFSEPLEEQVTSLDVFARDGTHVAGGGQIDPDDPHQLVLTGLDLQDGVYSVTWRTLSAADGHQAEGFFTFGIGDVEALPVGAADHDHSGADPVGVVGRWLTYLGLLLAIGTPVFAAVVLRAGPMQPRLVRLLGGGLLLSAVATAAVAVIAAIETGVAADYLFGSRIGQLQVARAVVAAVGGVVLLGLAPRFTAPVAMLAGLGGVVLLVVGGHASALPGIAPILAQVAHVTGVAVWFSGIVGLLALTLRPSLLFGAARPLKLRRAVPRFSALALISIGLVGLTGLYADWVQTGTILNVQTDYGRLLLIKTALAAGAIAIGGLNYLDGGRMKHWVDTFPNRLSVEVGIVVAVLAVTAILAGTAPLEEAQGVALEPIPDAFGEVAPGMEMSVVPGRPGVNRVVVTTTDALAAASGGLELGLDRVDTGSTTRVPLVLASGAGAGAGAHAAHGGGAAPSQGTAEWMADAIVLPAGSSWDTSVRILASDGSELSRQRFAFALDGDGISDGAARSLLDPAIAIAALLVLLGALGLGLGLGGMSLPRCEPWASRLALVGGGVAAVVLGILIGAGRLVG